MAGRATTRSVGRLAAWLERQAHAYKIQMMRERFDIDPSFRFQPQARVYGGGKAILGAFSYLAGNTHIQTGDGRTVRIGAHTRVGPNCRMYTDTTESGADGSDGPLPKITGDISIGDHVWVGHGCYVGPGVTIGDNAVVGALSLVNRDVEPYEIVGGAPIRHLRWKPGRESRGPR